jgi:hypothetical protein
VNKTAPHLDYAFRGAGASEPGEGLSILVAEDNPLNQRLAARLLIYRLWL